MPITGIRPTWLLELFETGKSPKAPQQHIKKILRLLDLLDAAEAWQDLQSITGFHHLKGDRKGQCAISVTGNYRITFRFEDGEILDVDYVDYH